MKSDEPIKELTPDENSISRHISYLYGRTQKEIELYAAGIGVASDVLTRAVGELLRGTQNGQILGADNSVPSVRSASPARSRVRPQKVALAKLPHRDAHRRRGRPKKTNGAIESLYLEGIGAAKKIKCPVCGKQSDRRGYHSHFKQHLHEQKLRKRELEVKRAVRENNHAGSKRGYPANLPHIDASDRNFIITSEIAERTGLKKPQVFSRMKSKGIHITALAILDKGMMGAYPRSKVEPYIDQWKKIN